MNANSPRGSALDISENCTLTTNHVTFKDCISKLGVIKIYENGSFYSNNDQFIGLISVNGGVILSQGKELSLNNALMVGSGNFSESFIFSVDSFFTVSNSTFANASSAYAPAIKGGKKSIIRDSKFINLHANVTAGAIALKWLGECEISNCTFVNVTSNKNAGAIFAESENNSGHLVIRDSDFIDCSSGFGGAIVQLAGNLFIGDCDFIGNSAKFYGGAVYSSCANLNVTNSTFDNNVAGNYSAIYFDNGRLLISNSSLTNNNAFISNQSVYAVYLNDAEVYIEDSTFYNGKFNVYGNFLKGFKSENSVLDNATFSIDNENYVVAVENVALILNLTNNAIVVDSYPSRFDLRDWGWETPVRYQGGMGSCWVFAIAESLESALLKATGIRYDVSIKNIQDLQLKYSSFGTILNNEGSSELWALGNALSWYGVIPEEEDVYDVIGKVSTYIDSENRIHLQDAFFIMPNTTDYVNEVKKAILNYGSVAIGYNSTDDAPYFNAKTFALYNNESTSSDHGIVIIGWDDNYSVDNFLITPPGNGAWICKNSWDTDWADKGYFYMSYYESSLFGIDPDLGLPTPLIACIFDNTVSYHVNYQTDLVGLYGFDGNYTYYSNQFTSEYSELIGAVGTYFNESGIDYSFDIYVNGNLAYTQSGISEFAGYRTITLDKYVSVKAGDTFKVVFKSNAVPYQAYSRQHYIGGMSMISADGSNWGDITIQNRTVCLKVYTVMDNASITGNEDITVDYNSGSYFSVNVVTADGHAVVGAGVKFNINGKTTTVKTDGNGTAKIEITEVPGKYTITSEYGGKTCKNTVAVELNLKTCKVTGNKNIKVDYGSGSYFSVKVVSADGKVAANGASVKFKINGKTTTVKTNKKGIAKIKITDVPGKYTIKTTFNGKTYANKVTVKQVLKANKVTVKKTAKKFTLKAKLKIKGKSVKGKKITFKFNGKTYKVKTNSKGIAKKVLKKNVIKKLKKGKKYTVKVTYLKDTIKTNVKVKG